jgi:hypothetical protein
VGIGACIVADGKAIVGATIDVRYIIVYVGSMLVLAYSSILKEKLFVAGKIETGKPLDVFVVNVGGSVSQVRVTSRFRQPMTAIGPSECRARLSKTECCQRHSAQSSENTCQGVLVKRCLLPARPKWLEHLWSFGHTPSLCTI